MTGAAAVSLDRVKFGFAEIQVRFNAEFDAGSTTAILGPSGAGKSTLLNLIAGFERPARGKIRIGSADVTDLAPAERPVSMVFQENNLFSHLDVAQNVGLGRSPSLRLSARDKHDIAQALDRTGLEGKEKRLPRELSGGERQRVALARVLVRRRPVLLLDEPFASLDADLREKMLDLVAGLAREQGLTVLMVTHQPDDARHIADFVLVLEAGTVAARATKAAYFEARNGRSAFNEL